MSVKGKLSAKIIYQVMDPAVGGRYRNLILLQFETYLSYV